MARRIHSVGHIVWHTPSTRGGHLSQFTDTAFDEFFHLDADGLGVADEEVNLFK